jgi:hypothetical protein
MEFGLAFSYPFKDPDWIKKIVLIALVGLIPIIGQLVVLGWGIEITRRVIRREPVVLPDINFGAQLGDGFKAAVVSLVYSIPLIILIVPIQVIVPILATNSNMDQNTAGIISLVISVCCGGLALIYGIAMGFTLPAAFGNLAAKGGIGDGLRFGEVIGLVRAGLVPYLIVILAGIIGGFIAPLGAIACGIGALLTTVYVNAMMAHMMGQAYNQATAPKM